MNNIMKAWKINIDSDLDEYLTFQSLEIPILKPNQVLVKLLYASLNHRDVWIAKKAYPGTKNAILGSDGFGIVTKTYADEDQHMIGKKFLINPSVSHWSDNKTLEILGMPQDGTFAEYIAIDKSKLFAPLSHLEDHENAAIGLVGLTAFRMIYNKAKITPDSKILITGIGGSTAQFCLYFAALISKNITITSGEESKMKLFKNMYNFIETVNYKDDSWNDFLENNVNNFDVTIDSSGADIDRLLDILKPNGKFITYGATAIKETKVTLRKIFGKELSLLGSTMGTETDFSEMLAMVEKEKIHPIIDVITNIKELKQQIDRVGKQFGKIIFKFSDEV